MATAITRVTPQRYVGCGHDCQPVTKQDDHPSGALFFFSRVYQIRPDTSVVSLFLDEIKLVFCLKTPRTAIQP